MITEILTGLGEAMIKAAEVTAEASAAAEVAEIAEAADAAIESVLQAKEGAEAAEAAQNTLQVSSAKKPGCSLLSEIAEKLEKTGVMDTARKLEAESIPGASRDVDKAMRNSHSIQDILVRVREKAETEGKLEAAKEINEKIEMLEAAREGFEQAQGTKNVDRICDKLDKLCETLDKLSDSAVLRPDLLGGYSMRASRLVGRGARALKDAADERIMKALETVDAADAAALESEAQVLESLSEAVEAGEKSMGAMSYLEYMARHAYD